MKAFIVITSIIIIISCAQKTILISNERKPATKKDAVTEKATTPFEQGRILFKNNCGRCHALPVINKYPKEEWSGILDIMIPKSRLNNKDSALVSQYVFSMISND